jgi:hypothetical protein
MSIKFTNIFHKTLKIYPNRPFWFENIPSGNTDLECCQPVVAKDDAALGDVVAAGHLHVLFSDPRYLQHKKTFETQNLILNLIQKFNSKLKFKKSGADFYSNPPRGELGPQG